MTARTEIASLGEFGIIDRIKQNHLPKLPSTLKGIGDDAAIIAQNETTSTVLSTELFVEGVHFDLRYFPLKHLGYKIVAAGVSDIAAMNAIPTQITVGLGLSNRFSVEAIDELYDGICTACEAYNVDLVGGDTTASRSGLVLSITAMGIAETNKIAYRNTAQPNDVLCVTGDLGSAYAGLQILEREKQEFLANPDMQPQLTDKQYVVGRQLKPEARTDIVHELRELGVVPTSMIDISDGLASELLHLCTQSGVGAGVFEEHLPIDDQTFLVADELNLSPLTMALNGGDDYELLFTIKQADYEKVKKIASVSFIGYMTNEPSEINLITKAGTRVKMQAQGWVV